MTRLVLCALLAVLPAASLRAESLYDQGMAKRSRGDARGAKVLFLKLLEQSPESGGALEGLSLTCLSLGQYEEALGYLRRWNSRSPHNAYILGLMARAQRGLRDEDGALASTIEMVEADPRDWGGRRMLDSAEERVRSGVLPKGRIYKSLSAEELNTPRPQRIVYEGHSGGLRARARVSAKLAVLGGAEFGQEAQRNDTGGFTYYNFFDQLYSAGLAAKPNRDLRCEAEYGQSLLHDIKGAGVGRTKFSRARLFGEWRMPAAELRLTLTRAPKYLRGAGGSQYFALLREDSARLEIESRFLGLDWLGRAGLDDYSEHTTYKTWSLLATNEVGSNLMQARYSHGPQEFSGAADDGRLAYVTTDRWGARWVRYREEKYRLAASYGYTVFSDANRLHEFDADATGWLPWWKELYGSYRFALLDYRSPVPGYPDTDKNEQWLGAYWRRGHGHGLWTMLGCERGFLWDASRSSYEGGALLAELEWYHRESLSLRAQGRISRTTVRDESYSLGLQARYSF